MKTKTENIILYALVKHLASSYGKVYYNSYEEGLSRSIMEARREDG